MNILITGATGQIGMELVNRLQGAGNFIMCQSRSASVDTLGVRWLKHDLFSDSWDSLSLPHIDTIYHLAGQTSTNVARNDPVADLTSNVSCLLNLLEHFRKQRAPPFLVLVGTVTQVGLADRLPINEALPDRPVTFYDISKLTAEMYFRQYVREGWIRGCVLRLSNVYGHRKSGQQEDRGVIDKIIRWAISGKNLTIYGDGSYIRDYVFIDDVISALVLASECAERTNGGTFCIGTGRGTSLKEAFLKVICLAASATSKTVGCELVPPPHGLSPIEFRNAVIDSSAFREATGWTPRYDFDAGLIMAQERILAEVNCAA